MKRFKLFLLALGLVASTTAFAANPAPISEGTNTSKELKKMLKTPEFIVDHDMEAQVLFTLTEDNEIVILSVATDEEQVASYVKEHLNHKTLKSDLEQGKQYVIPLKIKSRK
ncbi:MAG: hypothetical protein KJO05_09885 [Bacteroidia bacterium]|nr:hypothetical protein [Bacteroidia bacterium]NNF30204.1 hypothetical protein [Flavobacteriaceae bacterium]MBT8275473.1 hypothetical protein [Bacteroidia bacterium]NNJ82836.1 hypothetical protein [Flavobacteriaceae bacterium]NNK54405.1 hypothetical protein [Flavobacteriaceae bacterium]